MKAERAVAAPMHGFLQSEAGGHTSFHTFWGLRHRSGAGAAGLDPGLGSKQPELGCAR